MAEGTGSQVSAQISDVVERFSVRYGPGPSPRVPREVVWRLADGRTEVALSNNAVTLALHLSGGYLTDFETDNGEPLPSVEQLLTMVEAGIESAGGLEALGELAETYQRFIDQDDEVGRNRMFVDHDTDDERQVRCLDAELYLRQLLDEVEKDRMVQAYRAEQAEALAFHLSRQPLAVVA